MWILVVLFVLIPLCVFHNSWFLAKLLVASWIFPHVYGWIGAFLLMPALLVSREREEEPPGVARFLGAAASIVTWYLFLGWLAFVAATTRAHAQEVGAWLAWPLAFFISQTPMGLMMMKEEDKRASDRGFVASFLGFLAFAVFPALGGALFGWVERFFG